MIKLKKKKRPTIICLIMQPLEQNGKIISISKINFLIISVQEFRRKNILCLLYNNNLQYKISETNVYMSL